VRIEEKVDEAVALASQDLQTSLEGWLDHFGRDNVIAKFFKYSHLPPHLQNVSSEFASLAVMLLTKLPANAERTVALRKLLEAKDAAVRAALP